MKYIAPDGRYSREQQLIDKNGGAQLDIIDSDGHKGTSGNRIRGVSKFNPMGLIYHEAANRTFGNIAPYTGLGAVQELKNGKKKESWRCVQI